MGCDPVGETRSVEDGDRVARRLTRFGILEDLVLFERPLRDGGPFWLDRFETTEQDWAAWSMRNAPRGTPLPTLDTPYLPAVGMTFREAQSYAGWRLGRLPRFDEWKWAANGGGIGRYQWPWGNQRNVAWANTGDLQLGSLTPVGSFESGRQQAIGGPYDLIGNAAEWTISPARKADGGLRWLGDGFARRLEAVQVPAIACWLPEHLPRPGAWLLAVDAERTYRTVCGHMLRSMEEASQVWSRAPTESGSTTGVRIATDPETLLRRLLEAGEAPLRDDRRALRAFLSRPRHRTLVEEAWRRLVRDPWVGERLRAARWIRSVIDRAGPS